MTVRWIKKEIEGGNDRVAQIRDDYPGGSKLDDVVDGTDILVPDFSLLSGAEITKYTGGIVSGKPTWTQCRNAAGGLIFPTSNGKMENWVEVANTRNRTTTPPPPVTDGTKTYHIELDIKVTEVK